jgi:hypothetical protein
MKTSRVWAITGFVLTTLSGGTANAQSANFTLVNNTGFVVYSVYYWPSERSYPGPDRLGRSTITSGESHDFNPRDDECIYNIRITLETDGYEKQWDDLNLCDLSKFTLNYNFATRNLWASGQ